MSRYTSASPAVDDDCFAKWNRVFPSQRHSDNRLAIVMETRYILDYSVEMFPGYTVELWSTVMSVKHYQSLFGDLRFDSDWRVFHDFEVALTTTNGKLYTGKIQKHVIPLAQDDSQFMASTRRVAHIRNSGEKIATVGHVPHAEHT